MNATFWLVFGVKMIGMVAVTAAGISIPPLLLGAEIGAAELKRLAESSEVPSTRIRELLAGARLIGSVLILVGWVAIWI